MLKGAMPMTVANRDSLIDCDSAHDSRCCLDGTSHRPDLPASGRTAPAGQAVMQGLSIQESQGDWPSTALTFLAVFLWLARQHGTPSTIRIPDESTSPIVLSEIPSLHRAGGLKSTKASGSAAQRIQRRDFGGEGSAF